MGRGKTKRQARQEAAAKAGKVKGDVGDGAAAARGGKGGGKAGKPGKKLNKAELARQKKQEERLKRQELAMKRRANNRKKWQSNFDRFQLQLKPVGLMIRDVAPDGNCLFRAVCDQMTGSSAGHGAMRQRTVDFMEASRADFEFFIEDDVPFETAMATMRRDAVWAGHLELVAMSRMLGVNLIVHQLGSPPWEVRHFPLSARCIHISYHDGQHYASVRSEDDDTSAPAKPINLAERAGKAGGSAAANFTDPPSPSERMIMQSTMCADLARVRRVLKELGGDIDACIEVLIADPDGDDEEAAAAALGGSTGSGSGSGSGSSAGGGGGDVAHDWQCSVCTLLNDGSAAVCAVCAAPAPVVAPVAAAPPAAAVAGGSGTSSDPAASTASATTAAPVSCPVCSFANGSDSSACSVCGAGLPTGPDSGAAAPAATPRPPPAPPAASSKPAVSSSAATPSGKAPAAPAAPKKPTRRNDPCPCGSKLRYKSCCQARDKRKAAAAKAGFQIDPSALSNKERKALAKAAKEEAEAADPGGRRRRGRGSGKKEKTRGKPEPSSDSDSSGGGVDYTSVLI